MTERLEAVETEEECRAALGAAFPGLSVASLRYLAEGWDSTVFQVNGTHVFRFPKRSGVDAALRKEIRLLPALVPVLPVAIPDFSFVSGPTATYAWHVVGYELVPGVPSDGCQWTPGAIEGISPGLAGFLRALHGFPVDRATAFGVDAYSPGAWRDRYAALYGIAKEAAASRVPAEILGRFVADWERMLADEERFGFVPVLVHGDLAMEHVLLDDECGLSGVIDFGDAMVADPALDFAGFPDALAQGVLPMYSDSVAVQDSIMFRRAMYRRAGPLHAIAAGLELEREDLLNDGIRRLRWVYR